MENKVLVGSLVGGAIGFAEGFGIGLVIYFIVTIIIGILAWDSNVGAGFGAFFWLISIIIGSVGGYRNAYNRLKYQ